MRQDTREPQNRINKAGNVLIPNNGYIALRDWLQPILAECGKLQTDTTGTFVPWTPSRLIEYFGEKIDDPRSVLYWCYKNKIPVFSPGITDGAIGVNLYLHALRHPVFCLW